MNVHLLITFVAPIMILLISLRLRTPNASKRTGVHMMMYMFAATFVFYFYFLNIFSNEGNPCPYGSEYLIPENVISLFFFIFIIFFISDFLSSSSSGYGSDVRGAILLAARRIAAVQSIAAIFLLFYCFIHYFTRLEEVFWGNNIYLLMLSPAGGQSGAVAQFFGSIVTPVYFVSCILLAVSISSHRLPSTLGILGATLWLGAIEVSAASRVAGIGVLLFAIYRAATVGVLKPSVFMASGFGLYLIAAALAGRALGSFGMDNLFLQLEAPLEGRIGYSDLITNLFQGALSTGDGLLVSGTFPTIYKLLSLSPLPSFMDGFDGIREASEIRLGKYCPMGAVAELTNFGPAYWIFYVFIYISMVALINSRFVGSRVSPLLIVAANGLFSLFSIGGFTYPTRTVTRVLVYTFVLVMIAAILGRKRRRYTSSVAQKTTQRTRALDIKAEKIES